ncbi:MAG: TIGR00725 family protein [Actinomycetes bacterium]|jgi:hypothetical protein|nr:MAG: TIGR00725 family protein [Actinomycetota bacterium]
MIVSERRRRTHRRDREVDVAIQVAVCGPRDCTPEERRDARELGRLLAVRGAVVVCGGYTGVMEAVAEGAHGAGGTVVGVLSRADREGANPYLTVAIPTGAGEARNAIIVNSADAVIVVGGSWGTLSELALAMRRGRVPVVQLGGWRVYDERGEPVPGIRYATSPAHALELTGLWP